VVKRVGINGTARYLLELFKKGIEMEKGRPPSRENGMK